MLRYIQSTGRLYQDASLIGLCYSGRGPGLNNPVMQSMPMQGPIPVGHYTLHEESLPSYGPIVFRLVPSPVNKMFGRDGFLLHWDNRSQNFTASEGCIVPVMSIVFYRVKNGEELEVLANEVESTIVPNGNPVIQVSG